MSGAESAQWLTMQGLTMRTSAIVTLRRISADVVVTLNAASTPAFTFSYSEEEYAEAALRKALATLGVDSE